MNTIEVVGDYGSFEVYTDGSPVNGAAEYGGLRILHVYLPHAAVREGQRRVDILQCGYDWCRMETGYEPRVLGNEPTPRDDIFKAYNETVEGLPDPDHIGSAEYRMLHDYIMNLDDGPDIIEHTLTEIEEWAKGLRDKFQRAFRSART